MNVVSFGKISYQMYKLYFIKYKHSGTQFFNGRFWFDWWIPELKNNFERVCVLFNFGTKSVTSCSWWTVTNVMEEHGYPCMDMTGFLKHWYLSTKLHGVPFQSS